MPKAVDLASRAIPETEQLTLDIEKEAADAFAPSADAGQVEILVQLVNRRAHLTVTPHVQALKEYKRKRTGRGSLLALKKRSLEKKFAKLRTVKVAMASPD